MLKIIAAVSPELSSFVEALQLPLNTAPLLRIEVQIGLKAIII